LFINKNGSRDHFKKRIGTEPDFSIQNLKTMPKYVIEREIPGAGKFTAEQLKNISQTSCDVLNKMGNDVKWHNSYVAKDKIYCVYTAPNEARVREHAKLGGFPANVVSEVFSEIDPKTAQ
tara:strand:+ start:4122 stop:4481 length:360 start_codon:yes stop_codon:yes gene_type:complete